MKNLREKIENAVIRRKLSHRGGGIEIDLRCFGYDNEKMTAYQNYLGGGILGSIQNDCTIDNWQNYVEPCKRSMYMIMNYGNYSLEEIAEELRRYMHELTNHSEDEWECQSFEENQNMPVSAY